MHNSIFSRKSKLDPNASTDQIS